MFVFRGFRPGACRADSDGPDRLCDCTSRPAAAAKAETVSLVWVSWRLMSASRPWMLKTSSARRSSGPRPTCSTCPSPATIPSISAGHPRILSPPTTALTPQATVADPRTLSAASPISTGSGTSVPSSHGTYPVLNDPPGPRRKRADHLLTIPGFFLPAPTEGFASTVGTTSAGLSIFSRDERRLAWFIVYLFAFRRTVRWERCRRWVPPARCPSALRLSRASS